MAAVNYRHDLRLVRMNLFDGTMHCRKHGLLTGDEANDVLRRSGMSADTLRVLDEQAPSWLKRFWDALGLLSWPKCEPLS